MRLIDADALYIPPEEINAKMAVACAPTINAELVRHGKWDSDMGGVWCSVCGEYSEGKYTYCPNCGAKMEDDNEAD